MSRRTVLLASLAFALFLALPLAADPAPIAAEIEADVVEVDLDRERTQASGNARLSYQDIELHADDVTAERITGDVHAQGHLMLVQGERVLYGEALDFNLRSGVGVLQHARAVEQGVVITGEEIALSPERIEAREARFSTCDKSDPHYAFAARRITLTPAEPSKLGPPRSGTLSLSQGRLLYRGKTLLPLPGYSVRVGDIGSTDGTPRPVVGITGDDGPYVSLGYTLGSEDAAARGELNYRYTTSRGVRGYIRAYRVVGPAEVTFGYLRREDPSDRDVEPDDLEASLADVLVNRQPEYGVLVPEYRIAGKLSATASWLAGSYTEFDTDGQVELASGDRTSLSALLRYGSYPVSPSVALSHGLGWRRSDYSPGDSLTVRLVRHTAAIRFNDRLELDLSHITRRETGESPFLFDGVGPNRELLSELTWVVNPAWRAELVHYYDLELNESRDMIVEAIRTAHCLEYTIGWRRETGSVYVGVGIAPPSGVEHSHD
ncbi:MAG: LPS-assembly protein LptD [Armatimonadetes bacterium]|nr:LPS-assembly protein LptD [Armatimonadota bacterium]